MLLASLLSLSLLLSFKYADTPEFVGSSSDAACWVLLMVLLQATRGCGLFTTYTISSLDTFPSVSFGLWLSCKSFFVVLSLRNDALGMKHDDGVASNTRSFLRTTHDVLSLLLCVVVFFQRSREKNSFDPRHYVSIPSSSIGTSGGGDEVGGEEGDEEDESLLDYDEGQNDTTDTTDTANIRTRRHQRRQQSSSEYGMSLWEMLSFSWLSPLLVAGQLAPLRLRQLYYLSGPDTPEENAILIEREWTRYGRERPRSIMWALHRAYFNDIWYIGFLQGCNMTCTLLTPQLLNMLLRFIEDPASFERSGTDSTESMWMGYAAAFGLVLVQFLSNQFDVQYQMRASVIGKKIQGGMSSLIFQKSMRLSQPSSTKIGIGNIVNLMESDCMKLGWSLYMIHQLWSLPVLFVVGMSMLYVSLAHFDRYYLYF
jgi:hypothetical protein